MLFGKEKKEPILLMAAVKNGDLAAAKKAIKAGEDVNYVKKEYDKYRCIEISTVPFIIEAAYTNNPQMVALLLENGAKVGTKFGSPTECTALEWAAGQGFSDIIKVILEHGTTQEDKDKALHRAAGWFDTEETMGLLLDDGANIDHKNKIGFTPLMDAIRSGKESNVRFLLDAGANPLTAHGDYGPEKVARNSNNRFISEMIEEAVVEAKANPYKFKKKSAKIPKITKTAKSDKIDAARESIAKMSQAEIMAPENASNLKELIDAGIFADIFIGLDFKCQNALYMARIADIKANPDMAQRIQGIMQGKITKPKSDATPQKLGIIQRMPQRERC